MTLYGRTAFVQNGSNNAPVIAALDASEVLTTRLLELSGGHNVRRIVRGSRSWKKNGVDGVIYAYIVSSEGEDKNKYVALSREVGK